MQKKGVSILVRNYQYPKLRGRIIEKYGTLKEFFKLLSISQVQASKKINGKAQFSQSDMAEWGELLDIDLQEIGVFFLAHMFNKA